MKTILKLSLVTLLTLFLTSCNKDDDSGSGSSSSTPDEINQTEWDYQGDINYDFYFGTAPNNPLTSFYPINDYGIDSYFEYNKPNVTLHFGGVCNEPTFLFSSCTVSGTINGTTMTIIDNGTTYKFTNKYPNE